MSLSTLTTWEWEGTDIDDYRPSPGASAQLGVLVNRALGGDARAVVEIMTTRLRLHRDRASVELLADLYVLGIAYDQASEPQAMERTLSRALSIAENMGSAGWICNILALRALAHQAAGRPVEAVEDLTRAEFHLSQAVDDGLLAWGHSWLGTLYERMSLYELAEPHYQKTLALGADVFPLATSQLVDHLSAATMHSSLALELEMLNQHDMASRRLLHAARDRARAHADMALKAAPPEATPYQLVLAQLIKAQHDENSTDPASRVSELVQARLKFVEVGDDVAAVLCTAALAWAHHEAGDDDLASAEAARAIDVIPAQSDHLTNRYVRWVHLRLLAKAADAGAQAGLDACAATSRLWWAHRRTRLVTMRSAIAGYAQQQRSQHDRSQARTDPLTGLGNRLAYEEWLHNTSPTAHLTVLVLDLNGLKNINDNWGHTAGDGVLMEFGRLLRNELRDHDRAMRIGGDEFVVVLHNASEDDAAVVANRVTKSVAGAAAAASTPELAAMSVSIGWASDGDGRLPAETVAIADAHMYANKRGDR